MWPAYPTLRTDDIDFKTLVALLQDRHLAVLAGNPSHIDGPSPLKRVGDVGHAIALLRARQRKDGLEILVDDPYRPGGKHLRGEWIAAKQVRQFAFRDSDSTLTAVWVERYGAWTAESLARRRLAKRIDRIEEEAATAAKQAARTEQRLRARIAQLEAGGPVDCTPVVAEALDAERVAIRDLVEARRTGVNLIADLLAWLQGGLQGLGEAVSLRVREEPVLTVGLFRAAVTMLVGFGLGWSGEQVALMVAFIEAVTAWVARRQVTPTTSPSLPEGQAVRLPDGTAATVVKA